MFIFVLFTPRDTPSMSQQLSIGYIVEWKGLTMTLKNALCCTFHILKVSPLCTCHLSVNVWLTLCECGVWVLWHAPICCASTFPLDSFFSHPLFPSCMCVTVFALHLSSISCSPTHSHIHREGRSPFAGPLQRQSPTGSSPLPATSGATASSCGKLCRMASGRTGTWAIKM